MHVLWLAFFNLFFYVLAIFRKSRVVIAIQQNVMLRSCSISESMQALSSGALVISVTVPQLATSSFQPTPPSTSSYSSIVTSWTCGSLPTGSLYEIFPEPEVDSSLLRMPHCMGIHCRGTRPGPQYEVCPKPEDDVTLVCSVCRTAWAAIVVVPGDQHCHLARFFVRSLS